MADKYVIQVNEKHTGNKLGYIPYQRLWAAHYTTSLSRAIVFTDGMNAISIAMWMTHNIPRTEVINFSYIARELTDEELDEIMGGKSALEVTREFTALVERSLELMRQPYDA